MKDANIGRGLGIEKMGLIQYCGTTSAVADNPGLNRPSSLQKGIEVLIQREGEGVYIESNGQPTPGYNFPSVETEVEAGISNESKVVALDDTLVVYCFIDSGDTGKLKVRAGIVGNDGSTSWGTIQTVNNAATTCVSLTRVNDTYFAIAYCDDGGSDYLAARIGIVTKSDKSISLKTEKELTSAAIDKTIDFGTGICIPRPGVLAVAYALFSDGKGYVIAALFNTTTGIIATAGTPGEFDAGNDTKAISICKYDTGKVAVVYQAGGDTNDPINMSCGTVSDANVVVMSGEVTMAGAASTATSISCVALDFTKVAFSWIDSTFVHVNMATIVNVTPTKQTEVELNDVASLTPWITKLNNKELVVVYEDDADGDFGKIYTVDVDGSSLSKGNVNNFANAAVKECCVIGLRKSSPIEDQRKRVVIVYMDDANSDKGTAIVGHWDKFLMDVRSQVASAKYILNVFPVPGRKRTGV